MAQMLKPTDAVVQGRPIFGEGWNLEQEESSPHNQDKSIITDLHRPQAYLPTDRGPTKNQIYRFKHLAQ